MSCDVCRDPANLCWCWWRYGIQSVWTTSSTCLSLALSLSRRRSRSTSPLCCRSGIDPAKFSHPIYPDLPVACALLASYFHNIILLRSRSFYTPPPMHSSELRDVISRCYDDTGNNRQACRLGIGLFVLPLTIIQQNQINVQTFQEKPTLNSKLQPGSLPVNCNISLNSFLCRHVT